MFYLLRDETTTVYVIKPERVTPGAKLDDLNHLSHEAKHARLLDWKRLAVKDAGEGWALYQ